MSNADALLRDGDLDGARAALIEIVRSQPSDAQARIFLFQLLAVTGEWDKAKNQLQSLAQLSPEVQMLAAAYGQAIEAEASRMAVFAGQEPMQLLAGSDGWGSGLADAITLLAKGDVAAGIVARDAAFDAAPDCPGTFNGAAFKWIADADPRFGPSFEAIISGRYGLIPFDTIEHIKSEGPRDLRDIVWYTVQIGFRNGQSIAALLPARYPGSELSGEANEKLTRATGWNKTDWGEAGSGQHLWSLSTGDEHGILSATFLAFD